MTQEQQPQVSEERIAELRKLIGQEVFITAYTLQGDGTIEVGTIADAIVTPEGQATPVMIVNRPWRTHTLGVDTFFDLNEAVQQVTQLRDQEVKNLRSQADALVALQFKAPADKVKEAEEKLAAKQAEAEKTEASVAAKPAAKKPAAKKSATKK